MGIIEEINKLFNSTIDQFHISRLEKDHNRKITHEEAKIINNFNEKIDLTVWNISYIDDQYVIYICQEKSPDYNGIPEPIYLVLERRKCQRYVGQACFYELFKDSFLICNFDRMRKLIGYLQ